MRRYSDTLREKGYAPLLMRVGVNTGGGGLSFSAAQMLQSQDGVREGHGQVTFTLAG